MMRTSSRALVLLLTLLLSSLAFSQSTSPPVVISGAYSVDFGADQPRVIRDTLPGQTESAARVTYVAEKPPALRMVGTIAPYGGIAAADGEAYFDSMTRSIEGGMPGMKIASQRSIRIGTFPGREIEANNRQTTVLARMFVTEKELVFAQAVFQKGSAPGRAAATAFLGSLTVLPQDSVR